MSVKTLLIGSVALNVALLGAAAYLYQQIPELDSMPSGLPARAAASQQHRVGGTGDAGAGQGFGPVIEALLPGPADGIHSDMLDLETGCRLTEPDFFDHFKGDSRANLAWIRTNGLDISGVVFERRDVFCICYYMAVVPVDPRCWVEATGADVAGDPELGRIHEPKRTSLTLSPNKTDTYMFRTQEGTPGLLRVLGTSDDRRAARICYKLVLAPTSVAVIGAPARGALARKAF